MGRFAKLHMLTAAAAVASAVPIAAYAQVRTYPLDIPAQDLSSALKSLASTTGQQVVFRGAVVQGKRSPAIKGSYSVDQAVSALIGPSGLSAERSQRGVIVVDIAGRSRATSAPAGRVIPQSNDSGASPRSADGAASVSEMVVTAQKRSQRLLDVPLPVTSVSSDVLASQGIAKLSDFFARVPGLQYSGGRTSNLSIRGITTGGNTNPTVAILVDDVPFGGSTNTGQPPIPDFDPATLERVEVLRGPQGTLYGASSLGGLIKYVTREPNPNETFGRVEVGSAGVEDGDAGYSARASLNVPIVQDRVALYTNGYYRNDPRWLDNIFPAAIESNVNRKETWGGRAVVQARIADGLTLSLSALQQRQDVENSDLALTTGGIRICPPCQAVGNTAVTSFAPLYRDKTTLNVLPGGGDSKFELYTARADWKLDWGTVTSISAWSKAHNVLNSDVTSIFGRLLSGPYSAPANATVGIADAQYTERFSQEVRASGSNAALEWIAGAFYTKETSSTDQTIAYTSGATGTVLNSSGPGDYREYAAFADVTYHVSEKLDLQLGGRYARNRQVGHQDQVTGAPVVGIFGPSTAISATSEEDAATWLISPSYHFSPNLMGYARIATGYRPGGPNVGIVNANTTFGSDTVVNYEVGLKGYVIPSVFSIDASIFEIDWKDIQLQNVDNATQNNFLSNGGKARSRGLEVQSQWRPWQGFVVDASAALTDAVLTETIPTTAGLSTLSGADGDRLPFTAKFAASASAQQSFELSDDLTAVVGGTYSYIGDRLSAFNTNAPNATEPRIRIPGYSQVHLHVGLTYEKTWQLDLYVRNAFNKFGAITAQNRNGTGVPTALFTQPRTVGFTLARSF